MRRTRALLAAGILALGATGGVVALNHGSGPSEATREKQLHEIYELTYAAEGRTFNEDAWPALLAAAKEGCADKTGDDFKLYYAYVAQQGDARWIDLNVRYLCPWHQKDVDAVKLGD